MIKKSTFNKKEIISFLSPGAWYKVPQNQIGMVWHPELVFQNMEKLVTVSIYGSDEKYKIWYSDDHKEVQFYQTIQVVFPTLVSKNSQIFMKLANFLSWPNCIKKYTYLGYICL